MGSQSPTMQQSRSLLVLLVLPLLLLHQASALSARWNTWRTSARKPSYMDKYNYHHNHPKIAEELFSQRDNASIHFYSRSRGGRKISLVCVAWGKPRPHITWLKDGIELNSFSEHEHVFEWKIGSHKLKSKVEIDPAMQRDAGYYECQAYNK